MIKINKTYLEHLYKAILSLENIVECSLFFEDICTIQELETLAQRFEVANLLNDGKNYIDINKMTGASTATICRVSKCLNYGDGGYKNIIEKLNKSGE